MGIESKIGWTESTWNPFHGCVKISSGCKFCVTPDTLILYKDLSWRPIRQAKIGDEIFAFEENPSAKGHSRKYKIAVIEDIEFLNKPALSFSSNNKTLTCSFDHSLLVNNNRYRWKKAGNLTLSDSIPSLPFNIHEYSNSVDFMKGYIAGMTLGDGAFRYNKDWGSVWKKESKQCYWRIALSQPQMDALLRIKDFLQKTINVSLDINLFSKGRNDNQKDVFKIETRSQKVLKLLYDIIYPSYTISSEYKRGWVSGIFDAQGSLSMSYERLSNLRIANYDENIANRIIEYSNLFGIKFKKEWRKGQLTTVRLVGGVPQKINFFCIFCPIIQYKKNPLLNRHIDNGVAPIDKLEPIGRRKLVDIQTSTKTFIANGFYVHNCYMYRDKERYGQDPTTVLKSKAKFDEPLKWKEPKLIFTCSWSDWFIKEADQWRDELWKIIKDTPHHTYQILTKRPERILEHLPEDWGDGYENVWLGISAENHDELVKRMIHFKDVKAKVKFLSCEPLIGGIDLELALTSFSLKTDKEYKIEDLVNWVIIGGESGNENGKYKYRPCSIAWIKNIIGSCQRLHIPVFVKQLGTYISKNKGLKDRHATNAEEWEEDLRLQNFPE